MKKKILLFTSVVLISSYVLSSYNRGAASNGYDCTGAESSLTGTYANFTGCTNGGCHGNTTPTTTVGITITLDSAGYPTTHYKGGMTYYVKLTGTNGTGTSLPAYGFQLTAIKGTSRATTSTGIQGGTFASTGLPASTQLTAPGTYTCLSILEQSTRISVSGTTFTDSFSWTAPIAGTGVVSFWSAVNFVNGNGSADRTDQWDTAKININEWATSAGVATIIENTEVVAYPNPVSNMLNMQINGAEGIYNVTVYDLAGRAIMNENITATGNNYTTSINTTNWATGMYQINVSKDGNIVKMIPVVKK